MSKEQGKRFFFEKKKQKTFVMLGLCLVGLLGHAARADEKLTFSTEWTPYGAHAPIFLAAQKGWLKEAGLDVTIVDGKGSTTVIQLVGSGTVDVGFVQLGVMAGAIDQGIPVTSIAGFVRAGDNGVLVPMDSPIKEPKDLIGKRIVYPMGGGSAALMDAFFAAAHLPRADLTLVGVDSSALASTYVAGNVDAAITTVAYLMPMIDDKRPSRAIPYASVGLIVPSFGLTVRTADVTKRADAFAKLVPVIDRSWTYIADGHVAEAIDAIVAQRPNEKLDKTVMTNQLLDYLKLLDTPATKGHPIGWQAEADWATAIAALKATGTIKQDRPLSAYYTNEFVK